MNDQNCQGILLEILALSFNNITGRYFLIVIPIGLPTMVFSWQFIYLVYEKVWSFRPETYSVYKNLLHLDVRIADS